MVQLDLETGLKATLGVASGVVVGFWTIWGLGRTSPKLVSAAQAMKESQNGIEFTIFRFLLPTVAVERWLTLAGATGYAVAFAVMLIWWWPRRQRDTERLIALANFDKLAREIVKGGTKQLDLSNPVVREQTKALLNLLGQDPRE